MCVSVCLAQAAGPSEEAELAARQAVPQGGNFQPNPQIPAIVAAGGGGRILVSTDDGRTWEQRFFGAPTASHGHWTTRSLAYTDGLFAMPTGWGRPPMVIASEDGLNWRHFLPPKEEQTGPDKFDPLDMPGAWKMAGGGGTFVFGSHDIHVTPDFGKSWRRFHVGREFREDPRKLNTHHLTPHYLGVEGHFLIVAQDRTKEDVKEANLFLTEDDGVTWQWLETKGLENGEGQPASFEHLGDIWLLGTREGKLYRSTDRGRQWEGPMDIGFRYPNLTIVDGEFWATGEKAFSSKDGKTWTPLPEAIPAGQVLQTPEGTLLSVHYKRNRIMRSTDGGASWEEVFAFEGEEGAEGLVDLEAGHLAPSGASTGQSEISRNHPFRTWTATNGDQVEARLLKEQSDIAQLQTQDGKVIEVPVKLLKKSDQEYLREVE